MNRFTKAFLLSITPIACTIFVFLQTGKCILKFLDEPQVTNMRIDFNGDQPLFPTLTICHRPNEAWTNLIYNLTILKSCNISSITDYQMGNWVGNCSDPKLIFEKSVAKSYKMIRFVEYSTFHDYEENKKKFDFLFIDAKKWGRCFSIVLPSTVIEKGLKDITLGIMNSWPFTPRL